jgi:predicted HicB family RNase H-like nuclease
MTVSADQRGSQADASIRMDARLDATTRAKVDDLAARFHQTRAAVLRYIMHWGLQHGQAIPLEQEASLDPVRHLYLNVDTALQEQLATAAAASRIAIAAWVRQMVRQITLADFPESWQEAHEEARSHDSRRYGTRFMLRLDAPSGAKLQQLVDRFGVSRAAVIRQLIAYATPDAFPRSWHSRAAEHRAPPSTHRSPSHDGGPRS